MQVVLLCMDSYVCQNLRMGKFAVGIAMRVVHSLAFNAAVGTVRCVNACDTSFQFWLLCVVC